MSTDLSRLVSAFTQSLTASLEALADPALRPFIESIRGVMHEQAQPIAHPHREHPALRFLDAALADAGAEGRLRAAVREIVPHLSFGSSYADDGPLAAVGRGMVWAEVAGRTGLVRDPTRRVGCFLLEPGHHYPLHGHVADEIYFVLSGLLTVEHGLEGEKVHLPPGRCYRTPSGEPHALHIGASPVLLAYCWVGDFDAPIWFLEKDAQGSWTKSFPGSCAGSARSDLAGASVASELRFDRRILSLSTDEAQCRRFDQLRPGTGRPRTLSWA